MKSKRVVFIAWAAFLMAVVSACGSSLCAQSSSTGGLAGTVTDPSGGVIPNTTVTLTNNATGQTQTTTTSGSGTYRFSLLPPGTYSVKFSAQGFKTSDAPSVTVNVTEVPVLDAKLEVGETTQQVTVTGEAVALQTETSAIGTLVDSKSITSVPLTTRNYTQVLSLSAGAVTAVNNAANLGRGTQDANVNGNSVSSNNYQMDGADANNWTINTATDGSNEYGGVSIPNPDALAEFKIQTSQFDAGYGRNAGANVNVVTKSGGNDFHGTAFEFVRNDIFNANDFFRNSAGQPRPNFKQNQFGGVFGGPIKKNKLFFFGSYQGTRQINGLDKTSLSTDVLPPLTNDRSAATIAAEFCPANHPGDTRYNTFAGGKQVSCTNTDTATTASINPVALALLQFKNPDGTYLFSTPQTINPAGTTGTAGLGSSSFSVPSRFREDQILVNTDYVISSKHTLSERYFRSYIPSVKSFNIEATGGVVPGSPASIKYTDNNASLKLTSILTNNLVNEARVGFTQDFDFSVGLNIPTAGSLGMTPVDPLFPEPGIIVISGSLGSFNVLGGTANDWVDKSNQLQFSDQISWVHGKHTIRAGGDFEKEYWHVLAVGRARGTINISNFTDFLLGLDAAHNGSPTGQSNIFSLTAQEGAGGSGALNGIFAAYPGSAFVQDDIKVNSRFTLNVGLRWEYIPGSFDEEGKTGNIDPNIARLQPIPPLSGSYAGITISPTYNPNLINPYTGNPFGPAPVGVSVRPSKTLYTNNAPVDDFAPRFGFAWQPIGNRLVLRGGYGFFFQTPGGNVMNTAGLTTMPFAQRIVNTGSTNNFSTLQKPFPTTTLGFLARTPTSQLTDVVGGPSFKSSMVQQWSLNTQYQLSSTWTMEIGYVGGRGAHLFITQGFNQPILASPSNPVNCGYDGVATDCITTNTAKNAALRVPIMGFTPTALKGSGFSGNSWYHGLQTTLRKQISHGLTAQIAYTYSKAEANAFAGGSTTVNGYNDLYTAVWSRQPFDRTHRLITSYTYELPGPSSGFAGTMLKGWSVSGVTTVQTGTPMTLTDSRGGTIYGNANGSTAQFCPGSTNASVATSGRDQSRLGQAGQSNWFNLAAICAIPFFPVALGGDGLARGYGNMGQSIVTGPGQFNWDISFSKITKVGGIREDAQFQFRTEFYNAFNHPQFANPGTAFNSSSTFGVITATSVAPRLIQFGLKYIF
jgi:hypothetical protein